MTPGGTSSSSRVRKYDERNWFKVVSGEAVVLDDTVKILNRGTQKCGTTTTTCEAEYVGLCDAA